ncbi:NAD(P)/FAD-dependent oxidoreductase [Aquihabitans daechungensis]|uniref:NAD(P)/FAD-dependent oxidoreductase n=1 Tax=Aquihabitans daechungensis TaxID=1052257 RepID=UPI003BA2C1EB
MTEPTRADVAIVGAGPAGAAAAITLARGGRSVVLLDKAAFPRDKICGDGITTGALRILQELGVQPGAVASWTEVSDIHVVSPSKHRATFPLPRGRGQFAAVMRRTDLDDAIVDQAREAGATVLEGVEVTGATDGADEVVLELADGSTVTAAHVIAADGMWSPMRKFLGTAVPGYLGEWHAFRQYFRNTGPQARDLWVWFEPDLLPGYAWSFPLPDGGANVGFGIQRGAKIATKEMKALWPELLARPHIAEVLGPDAVAEDRHQAWPIPARTGDLALSAGRVLWVGDAAAVTDPMTGEGIGQALLTGQLAAHAILDGVGDPAAVRAAYERGVATHLLPDHKMSLLLIRALKHRKGARAAIRVADATPWTRRNFARWLFEDEPRAIAVTPGRWHRRILRRDGAYARG